MRQVHGPAEKLLVDFAGDTVPVFDAATGVQRLAHVFVAVLGASNYTFAEARWSEGLVDWIGLHVNALRTIGGVPKAIVCDNLKAGVTATCRYEPGINRTYQELAEHYGAAILSTRPRKPRDKAKVEVAVQIVQRFVLARLRNRRFFSLDELNAAIREAVADLNARSCASSARAATSCSQRSTSRRSKPCRRCRISMPSGRSAGSRPAITSRSPVTTTRYPHA
jgi:transposase